MLTLAGTHGLPIRDPDARYVGSPLALISLIVAIFVFLDVVPRAAMGARDGGEGVYAGTRRLFLERWWGRRGAIVVVCILGFYATYLSYRNLKSFVPFVTDGSLHDAGLLSLDKTMFFGTPPSSVLHSLLGTGISAEVLSAVYLAFLTFVPLSIGAALIWSSRIAEGVWYVTALALCWMLGALSYYVVPSLGPIYADPHLFNSLPTTGVSQLQQTLMEHRNEVLANPGTSDTVQSIAGFASLHIAVVFTAALIAQLAHAPRVLRIGLWTYFSLTLLATIYFGWHYVIDDVAGLGIGLVAVFGAAAMVGVRPGAIRQPDEASVPARTRTRPRRFPAPGTSGSEALGQMPDTVRSERARTPSR